MYYADYFINGGFKSVEDGRMHPNGCSFEWQCCTGTYPQDVAEYANMLYYRDESGLYVSQYLASSVEFEAAGGKYVLENSSFYPKEKTLRFRLHADKAGEFAIRFRVPSWACGENNVRINGVLIKAAAVPDTWLTLEREWKDGDEVEIQYEFVLRFQPVDRYAPQIAALVYGPIVLVCDKMTLFSGDVKHPEEWIHPVQKDGYSFAFRTEPGHVQPYGHLTREFYPYYEVPQMEWYYMYNRILE